MRAAVKNLNCIVDNLKSKRRMSEVGVGDRGNGALRG